MIIQTMLRNFPPPPDCYLYGPVCVAETERGRGLAGALFRVLQAYMAGRPAMTFIRADNLPSLRAHRKMGMSKLGTFVSEDVSYIALSCPLWVKSRHFAAHSACPLCPESRHVQCTPHVR